MTISAVEHQRRETLGLRDAVASCCSSPLFTCPVRKKRGNKRGRTRYRSYYVSGERRVKGEGPGKICLPSSNVLHSVREMEGVLRACV